MKRTGIGDARRVARWARWGTFLTSLSTAASAAAQDEPSDDLSGYGGTETTSTADALDTGSDTTDLSEAASAAPAAEKVCHPDCRPGYECVKGDCISQCNPPCGVGEVCSAERQCLVQGLTAGSVVAEENVETERVEREERLVGIKFFGGLSLGGGVTLFSPLVGNRLRDPVVDGAFQFGFRGGVFIRQVELSLDVSPGTYLPQVENGASRVSFLALVGYHGHVTDNFYWPLRIGAGLTTYGGNVVFQGRLDLLSLSMKTKYVLTDFTFPSFRYVSDFDNFHMWTGLFNVTVSFISE